MTEDLSSWQEKLDDYWHDQRAASAQAWQDTNAMQDRQRANWRTWSAQEYPLVKE